MRPTAAATLGIHVSDTGGMDRVPTRIFINVHFSIGTDTGCAGTALSRAGRTNPAAVDPWRRFLFVARVLTQQLRVIARERCVNPDSVLRACASARPKR